MYLSLLREERTPSFSVSYDKNLWHDFGTGEGGSIIDLVARMEGCSEIEAARRLAIGEHGTLAHAWPGNVRELKQKIQTAVLQSEGDMITEADLELDNEPSATSACFTLKSGDEERGRILRALKQAAGNKKMAAKILGIGRTTLYNKLVEYGLNEEN